MTLKKESEVVEAMEDRSWKVLSLEAMKGAWGKDDDVWDKLAKKGMVLKP